MEVAAKALVVVYAEDCYGVRDLQFLLCASGIDLAGQSVVCEQDAAREREKGQPFGEFASDGCRDGGPGGKCEGRKTLKLLPKMSAEGFFPSVRPAPFM